MKFLKARLALGLLSTGLLTACGSPGVPLPPSLVLARPVTNLRAARKGDKVTLTWTAPTKTTDQQNIRRGGVTAICRSAAEMKQCGTPVGQVPYQKPSLNQAQTPETATYSDQLPANSDMQNPSGSFFYAVSVENPYGKSAGLSNQVQVPAAPALPAPSGIHAQLAADGVHLTWPPVATAPQIAGLRFAYRVYRRESATKADAIAGELPIKDESATGIVDQSFQWEKTYDYRCAVVTFIAQPNGGELQVEGDDSPSVTVAAHDVFPPATPSGLQAVFSGPGQKPFIDLVWTPNTEADLAGYNIYRHEQNAPAIKINSQLVKESAYRDTEVQAGHNYSYSVSAVDVRANESQHSEEASESVPAP